jgi:hypothetical protein
MTRAARSVDFAARDLRGGRVDYNRSGFETVPRRRGASLCARLIQVMIMTQSVSASVKSGNCKSGGRL